jgi:hypothetical protein
MGQRRDDGGSYINRRSGGFDKGRLPVRLPGDRAAFWRARFSPIWAAARVPLSNPPRLGEMLRPSSGPVIV